MAQKKPRSDQKIMDKIMNNIKSVYSRLFNTDYDFIQQNRRTEQRIRQQINSVLQKHSIVMGNEPMSFLTQMYSMNTKGNRTERVSNEISELLQANLSYLNDLYLSERGRILLYDDYWLICDKIGIIEEAIDAVASNILSPDDFTKTIFSIFYDDQEISQKQPTLYKHIEHLKKTYHIEDNCKEWIKDSLIYGDVFLLCIPYEIAFKELEQQQNTTRTNRPVTNQLREEQLIVAPDEAKTISRLLRETQPLKPSKSKPQNWRNELAEIVNSFEYTTDLSLLLQERLNYETEYSSPNAFSRLKQNIRGVSLKSEPLPLLKRATETKRSNSRKSRTGRDTKPEIDIDTTNIRGTYLKELDRKRIVKLYHDGVCYGYLYFEQAPSLTDRAEYSTHMYAPNNMLSLLSTYNPINLRSKIQDPKFNLILNLFVRNITKRINKSHLENNNEFKMVIYNILKGMVQQTKRVHVIYIPPEYMVHLMPNIKKNGYGRSVLEKALFAAKLFLATLISELMMKISRGVERRLFYIETGLSEDIEGIVSSFIRDIKTRDIKMADFNTVDSILNAIGRFEDYFIPVINGTRPVEIDTAPGMSSEVSNNDFLDFLRKYLISTLGVPPSFISYADEMEFARSVSMMNGMFLRKIIVYQIRYQSYFTTIFQNLYYNEYLRNNQPKPTETTDSDNETDNNVSNIDYTHIKAVFPPPATLNLTNMSDMMNQVRDVSEFIVNTIAGENASETTKQKLKLSIIKRMMPTIDWDHYENLLYKIRIEDVRKELHSQLSKPAGGTEEETGGGGGYGGF